jgi:hypothetical protein
MFTLVLSLFMSTVHASDLRDALVASDLDRAAAVEATLDADVHVHAPVSNTNRDAVNVAHR